MIVADGVGDLPGVLPALIAGVFEADEGAGAGPGGPLREGQGRAIMPNPELPLES